MFSSKMKSRREKYEENNQQLVEVVIKLRKKVANLERELIKKNRFAQNQHDENVVLKIKLTEKENYAQMMQSSAIELISQNSIQMQQFLIKIGLKIPTRHSKQANGRIIGKQLHNSINKDPEKEKCKIQQNHNEKSDSHQDKPIQLKVFEKLMDRSSSSLCKSSDDVHNESSKKNDAAVQRKSLSMASTMDNDTVLRSPIGKKHTYDDEINESLRILKERKTGTSLESVPDESNGQNANDQDLKQVSESMNHSSTPLMSQKVKQKRRSEIVPNFMTPVKLMRSDSNLSPAHIDQSHGQSAADKENVSTSNHLTGQSIFQNVVIKNSPKLEMNSQLLAPVESMRSNTILLRSPTNMDIIQNKDHQPNRSHSDDESVHKRHAISSHAPESSDDKHMKKKGRIPISSQSDGEQTPISGRFRRSRTRPVDDRPRRSQTPVDYRMFFKIEPK